MSCAWVIRRQNFTIMMPVCFSLKKYLALFLVACTVSVSAQTLKTVVLDAGHGGKDPGNLGTGRYKKTEKDVALSVVLKLGGYIQENYPGVKVIYTRKTDKFIPLHERTQIANKSKADLFISVHCNSAKATSASGTETFVMGTAKDKENLELMKKENSVIYLEDDYQDNYMGLDPTSPESSIFAELYQNAFQGQSINFASMVENEFSSRVKRRSRGVKQSILFVMNQTTMPGVLIELGFLTNRPEEDFLLSDMGQTYMASAIYRAFKEYKTQFDQVNGATDESSVKSTQKEKEKPSYASVKEENVNYTDSKVDDDQPVFKVQLLTSHHKVDTGTRQFKGLVDIQEHRDGKYFKYTSGVYHDYEKAKSNLEKAKNNGFKDAYIIALQNGERISVKTALNLN